MAIPINGDSNYVDQLEEEIYSLKNLLDDRTRELDECKSKLASYERMNLVGKKGEEYSSQFLTNAIPYDNTIKIQTTLCLDGETLSSNDVSHLKHLWKLHIQRENNPPLLDRIWRKIISCLRKNGRGFKR